MSNADGDRVLNALTDIEAVHKFARTLEEAEVRRLGVKTAEARVILARKLRTSPGTLENIRRLRTKIVPAWLMARIRAEFVSLLQNEIVRLEHEIALCRQTGTDPRDDALASAETYAAKAREILESAR